jgi:hypothetical protein
MLGDYMKYIFTILILLSLVITLTACSTTNQQTITPPSTQYSASTQSFSDNGLLVEFSPVFGTEVKGTPQITIKEVPDDVVSILVVFMPTAGDLGYNLFDSPKVVFHMLDNQPRTVDIPTVNLSPGRYRLQITVFGLSESSEPVAFIESYYTLS